MAARAGAPGVPVIVSTEDEEIAILAQAAGAEVVRRPDHLANDSASTESALLHVLDNAPGLDADPDWLVCLQPTSPFRGAATVARFLAMAANASVDCLLSMTETRADFWRPGPDGNWSRLFPECPRRQQDREPIYEENSAVYLARVSALRETGSILGRRRQGVLIDPVEGLDINTAHDLAVAEAMVAAGLAPITAAGNGSG